MHFGSRNTTNLQFHVVPSPSVAGQNEGPMCIYNTINGLMDSFDHSIMDVYFENKRLYEHAQKLGIDNPTFSDINKLIAD